MRVVIGGVYVAKSGSYLRLISKGELLYYFLLVDKNDIPIPEKRNRFGHVVLRSKREYSEETVMTFKLVK